MIEPYKPYIEQLLHSESWRAGQGDISSLCAGSLSYDGTRFWLCSCGKVGIMPVVHHHPLGGEAKSFIKRFTQALQRPSPAVS